jgi:para-aminobenzoate synthetase component 1
VEELLPAPDPAEALVRLARKPYCLFLDSALAHREIGRYSFLAADPFAVLGRPVGSEDVFNSLGKLLSRWTAPTAPGLPPFQGGAAGLFSYDLNRSLEKIPAPQFDEFRLPALAVGLYDVVLAWDRI